jgi:hypothetical protein
MTTYWYPQICEFTPIERTIKIEELNIGYREEEIDNIRKSISWLEKCHSDVNKINIDNLTNGDKVIKRIVTVVDKIGYTVEISDHQSKQHALQKLDNDIEQYDDRINEIIIILANAYESTDRINDSFNDSIQKSNEINKLMVEINDSELVCDKMINDKKELDFRHIIATNNDPASFLRKYLESDIKQMIDKIDNRIRKINEKRNKVNILYNNINDYKINKYNI